MTRKIIVTVMALALLPCLLWAESEQAKDLVKKMDDLLRGSQSSMGTMKMIIKKKRWRKPRTIEMKFWEEKRGENEPGKSLILITSPIDEEGKAFLKLGNEMWSYFPDVNTTTKIPPSMMLQSWMGSDFTNDDLVRESSVVIDYTHEIIKEEDRNGFHLVTIQLNPKPDAPVTWGKIVITVRAKDAIPTREEYYNERGELVRVMTFDDIKDMHGRTLPTRWTLLPQDEPGDSTVLILEDIEFNVDISEHVFTMANLRKGGQ